MAAEARRLGSRNVLVVCDPTIKKLGVADQAASWLAAEGIASKTFSEVEFEPSADGVDRAAEFARSSECDLVIAIGGGSAMDTAKALAVLMSHPGKIRDYIGTGLVPKRGVPTILVPTTSGTGAEMTPNSLFYLPEVRDKQAMVSPHTIPDVAIVDPLLTVTVPPAVTAATGVDALCHAIESYTSSNASPMTDIYALEAVRLIGTSLRTAVGNGSDLPAREGMARASFFAGISIGNAGTNAVHALAYPLQGQHRITHGIANSLLLPYVLDFNAPSNLQKFARVAEALGEAVDGISLRDAALKSASACRVLSEDVGIPRKLSDVGVKAENVDDLVEGAMKVTRLLANNPRRVTRDDVRLIFERAL